MALVSNAKMTKRELRTSRPVYLFSHSWQCALVISLDNGFLSINLKDSRICGFAAREKTIQG